VIHEKVCHAPRITVWVAISNHGLLWPIFFEETVNSECYLSMSCILFCPTFLLQVCCYRFSGSCRMESGHAQQMLFWPFCIALSSRVSSHTGFLVVILNTWFLQDKSPCSGLSLCVLVSNTVIEMKILLTDQILDHFIRHSVHVLWKQYYCFTIYY
jgi:hypothetical protein